MPGPHINNFNMLINEIEKMIHDNDSYREKRKTLNNQLNTYATKHNSKDILEFCNIKLGE